MSVCVIDTNCLSCPVHYRNHFHFIKPSSYRPIYTQCLKALYSSEVSYQILENTNDMNGTKLEQLIFVVQVVMIIPTNVH